jgi:hypothetical protein
MGYPPFVIFLEFILSGVILELNKGNTVFCGERDRILKPFLSHPDSQSHRPSLFCTVYQKGPEGDEIDDHRPSFSQRVLEIPFPQRLKKSI